MTVRHRRVKKKKRRLYETETYVTHNGCKTDGCKKTAVRQSCKESGCKKQRRNRTAAGHSDVRQNSYKTEL